MEANKGEWGGSRKGEGRGREEGERKWNKEDRNTGKDEKGMEGEM